MMRLATCPFIAIAAAIAAITTPAAARDAPLVTRHAGTPPGLILQGVTVSPGATMLYLSGQVAAPTDPAKAAPGTVLTLADVGDTKTQTISALTRIKHMLEAQGFAMSDVIKLTIFVVGDPALGGKMDFAGVNAGFRQFFGTAENPNTVARSTVQVEALAGPAFLVEIEATAAR